MLRTFIQLLYIVRLDKRTDHCKNICSYKVKNRLNMEYGVSNEEKWQPYIFT